MRKKIRKWIVHATLLAAGWGLCACSAPPPPVAAPAIAPVPALPAPHAAYRIVAGESLIAITVRRSGPFARIGHDHVVATRQLEGFIDGSRAELRFRLDQLSVDEPGLRREAGLATQPSADAVDGTRRNMFSKVLQADAYPWVLVRAELEPGAARDRLKAAVTLHGVTRDYRMPVHLRDDGGTMRANGAFVVKQTDFGITPFAVLGGALSVKDELELRFAVSARR